MFRVGLGKDYSNMYSLWMLIAQRLFLRGNMGIRIIRLTKSVKSQMKFTMCNQWLHLRIRFGLSVSCITVYLPGNPRGIHDPDRKKKRAVSCLSLADASESWEVPTLYRVLCSCGWQLQWGLNTPYESMSLLWVSWDLRWTPCSLPYTISCMFCRHYIVPIGVSWMSLHSFLIAWFDWIYLQVYCSAFCSTWKSFCSPIPSRISL
jgi:hypothetical protein